MIHIMFIVTVHILIVYMTFLHKLMAEDSMAVKSSREISLPHNIRSECLLLFCLIINADDEILLLGCHSHAY